MLFEHLLRVYLFFVKVSEFVKTLSLMVSYFLSRSSEQKTNMFRFGCEATLGQGLVSLGRHSCSAKSLLLLWCLRRKVPLPPHGQLASPVSSHTLSCRPGSTRQHQSHFALVLNLAEQNRGVAGEIEDFVGVRGKDGWW